MTSLFDPVTLGELTLPNRVTMAALTRQRADEDGVPTALHERYYAQRASSGLVVTEGTFPSFASRGFAGQAGIADDAQAAGWARVATAVHEAGGRVFMQVMHAGRMSHPALTRGVTPEAPSAIAPGVAVHVPGGKEPAPVPRALETDELPRVRDEFVAAARRAVDAGLDGVELHGANGYLLHEFLAPSSNHRADAFGGSPEERARFVVEVVRAVADEIGAHRVGLRISPEHNVQGVTETDVEQTRATYRALLEAISGLGLAYVSVLHREIDGQFVADLRSWFGGPLVLNSGFGTVTQLPEAQRIVEDNLADAVAVGRELIANPDLVQRWRDGLELNAPDSKTFYKGGATGYTDYPFADVVGAGTRAAASEPARG